MKKTAFLIGLCLLSQMVLAFPLYPARIHFRGVLADEAGEPITTSEPITFSVWQGGSADELDSGKLLYQERVEIKPKFDGYFQCWLGSGTVLKGKLEGPEFGLDKTLYLQTQFRDKNKRVGAQAVDGFYVCHGGAVFSKPKAIKTLRNFNPDFNEPTAQMARRPVASLYPDGKIQRENGSIIETTGSTTSGVQELLDYCAEHDVDGYIVGGSEPRGQQVPYICKTPVRIHPAQGFKLDTGSIILVFPEEIGQENGFTIDSCMMVNINIRGMVLYWGQGAAVAISPENPLPLDTFVGPTLVDTTVHITTIANRGSAAVLFKGSINYCRFEFNEINHGTFGIHVDVDCSFSNNHFICKHVHNQKEAGFMVEAGNANVWNVNYNCDAQDPYGIVTSAANDIWFANVHTRGKAGIVLEKAARGNQFHLMGLTNGFENKADRPTNRFYASPEIQPGSIKLGFAVETPAVPESNKPIMNRNPFPVAVLIKKPASVTEWSIADTYGIAEKIEAPLTAGQMITLMPAESIMLGYTDTAPQWRWRAVQ